jgi:hypothetical protein
MIWKTILNKLIHTMFEGILTCVVHIMFENVS